MKHYHFTNKGRLFIRVNKRSAKAAFIAGNTIAICACNLRPGAPYSPEYITSRAARADFILDDIGAANDFRNIVNSYEYYNCRNGETGRYAAFYIVDFTMEDLARLEV